MKDSYKEQTRIKQLIEQTEQNTQHDIHDLYSDSFLYSLVELTIEDCVKNIKGLKSITGDALISRNYDWESYKGALDLAIKVVKRTTTTDEDWQKYRSKIIDDDGYCLTCGEKWKIACGCAPELKNE